MATVATERDSLSAYGEARSTVEGAPLDPDELRLMDAYWRASLYLCLGMIYLKDNPLLREPLTPRPPEGPAARALGLGPRAELRLRPPEPPDQEVRPRRDLPLRPRARGAGAALERLPRRDLLGGLPRQERGRGRPAEVLQAVLLPRRDRQPLHAGDPGSIHEGGELGYSVSHAYGAAFDAPDRLVVVMVGDGEAETGPLATAWHSNKFLNPARDGAVLPVLHLNGYKINNPSILARISRRELEALFEGYGYTPYFVEGSEPESMHQAMAATLEHCVGEIRAIQEDARADGRRPAAALADDRPPQPEGLDGPARGGRPLPRRLLAVAPGADGGRAREPRAPEDPGTVAAVLQPGFALRRGGPADPRAEGPAAQGRAPDERQPRGERRPDPQAAEHPRLPRLRRRGEAAGRGRGRADQAPRQPAPRHRPAQPGRTSGCSAPTRRPRTGSRRRSRSPGRPGWARRSPRTPTAACSPPTAA